MNRALLKVSADQSSRTLSNSRPPYPSRKSLLKGRIELYLRAGKNWPFDWGNYIDCSL